MIRKNDSTEDVIAKRIIGRKYDYYSNKWKTPISINYAGGLFNILWMLYRRMYLFSIIAFIPPFLFSFYMLSWKVLESEVDYSLYQFYKIMMLILPFILYSLLLLFFGNYLYSFFIKLKILKIKKKFPSLNEDEFNKPFLKRIGGTSREAVYIGLSIIIIFLSTIYSLNAIKERVYLLSKYRLLYKNLSNIVEEQKDYLEKYGIYSDKLENLNIKNRTILNKNRHFIFSVKTDESCLVSAKLKKKRFAFEKKEICMDQNYCTNEEHHLNDLCQK